MVATIQLFILQFHNSYGYTFFFENTLKPPSDTAIIGDKIKKCLKRHKFPIYIAICFCGTRFIFNGTILCTKYNTGKPPKNYLWSVMEKKPCKYAINFRFHFYRVHRVVYMIWYTTKGHQVYLVFVLLLCIAILWDQYIYFPIDGPVWWLVFFTGLKLS